MTEATQDPVDHRSAWRLGALFFLLALWLAWFVTPHGDIPDESGHYGYVQDIADRGSLPLLGQATMARDIWRDVDGLQGKTRPNYIAQHPPLYYAVAAVPYRLLRAITDRKDLLPKAPRLVSALSLGLLVGLMVIALREAGTPPVVALALSAALGLLPLVPHLASGISNDIFLTMLAAGVTLSLVRFVRSGAPGPAYVCAMWMAAAGATKMTAWVLIAACLAVLLWELRRSGWSWVVHAAGLVLVAMSTSMLWMARNYHHFGNPFYVYGSEFTQKVFNTSHLDYLATQPFFEQLFGNLYASVGFSGYCQSPTTVADLARLCQGIRIMAEDRLGVAVFAALCAILLLVLLHRLLGHMATPSAERPPAPDTPLSLQERLSHLVRPLLGGQRSVLLSLAMGAIAALSVASVTLPPGDVNAWMHLVPALLTITMAPACLVLAIGSRDWRARLMAYGVLAMLLIALLVFHMGYKSFLINGYPRGLQGRYLLPFIPLLLVSIGLAIAPCHWRRGVAIALTAVMAALFLHTYLGNVMPFFQAVRV